jgi:hypothetical protein
MADAYDTAVSYRDSIVQLHEYLCGNEVPPEAEAWQDCAEKLARELRRYAEWLDGVLRGEVCMTIAFPSWKEDKE